MTPHHAELLRVLVRQSAEGDRAALAALVDHLVRLGGPRLYLRRWVDPQWGPVEDGPVPPMLLFDLSAVTDWLADPDRYREKQPGLCRD